MKVNILMNFFILNFVKFSRFYDNMYVSHVVCTYVMSISAQV